MQCASGGGQEPTCCIADVQMHHVFLVQEEGAEIDTAGCQHSFVRLEVHPVHDKGAVTQQALLALSVELLQNLPTVPRELHRPGRSRMVKDPCERPCEVTHATLEKAHRTDSQFDP